ncbi:DUF5955 family protein [Streptantibioticus parmotrematis]|uniref:DUF5955 family protein n=1 Tax=Streptantibioticus parmotrematis TaxID=2873249 RepID=UPI0033D56F97
MSNDRIGQCTRPAADRDEVCGEDPRVAGLRRAVGRLRRELACYRPQLSDRQVAEEELAVLDAAVADGSISVPRLRTSLLVVTSALGSVSALAEPVAALRCAIDLFGPSPSSSPRPAHPSDRAPSTHG